jgi:UrcA family protein
MKTSNVKQIAIGLLVAIGALSAAPISQAQTGEAPAGFERVSVNFAHDGSAPAATVYRDLQRTARKACGHTGDRLVVMRQWHKQCVNEMVESGISQFGRADIAELHKGRVTVASR